MSGMSGLSHHGAKQKRPANRMIGQSLLGEKHVYRSREVKKGRSSFFFTPRAAALRQARVSGSDLQNRLPSAAFGGATNSAAATQALPDLRSIGSQATWRSHESGDAAGARSSRQAASYVIFCP